MRRSCRIARDDGAREDRVQITTTDADGVTVVQIEGTLDTNSAPQAQKEMEELLADGRAKIVMDFSAVDFISSAGLRVLLMTAKKVGAAGGGLRLCGLNEAVREVIEMSGFTVFLSLFDNRTEALAEF